LCETCLSSEDVGLEVFGDVVVPAIFVQIEEFSYSLLAFFMHAVKVLKEAFKEDALKADAVTWK
jgi:hypothetical protein